MRDLSTLNGREGWHEDLVETIRYSGKGILHCFCFPLGGGVEERGGGFAKEHTIPCQDDYAMLR